jgi:tetratricopeptide (TPR) repeat protein
MNVLQAPDLAERYLQRALALDENHPRTHELMGEYYGRFGYSVTNNQDRVHYLNLALTHYERAVDLAKERHRTPPSFGLYVRMALLCRDLKSLDDEGIWELQPESNSAGAGEQGGYHRLSYGTDIVTYAAEALRLALGAETNHVKTLIESLVRSEDSFNLGRLYLGWAMFSTNSVDRRARESRAESCLAQAIRLSPSRMGPWHERALFQLRVLRDPEAAEGRVQQARATDENCPWVHDVLGDHYMRLASNTTDKRDRVHYDNLALRHYEWTVDFAKGGYRSPPSFDLYFRMALLCRELKNMDDEGIWELQLEPRGGDAGTKSGYRRSTFGAYATAYAAEALRLAPDSEKDNIRALIESSGILWER